MRASDIPSFSYRRIAQAAYDPMATFSCDLIFVNKDRGGGLSSKVHIFGVVATGYVDNDLTFDC